MDLLNNVTTPQFAALYDFIEDSFDNVDLSNPQAYLVYVYFNKEDMMVMPQYSGIIQVGEPDELARLEHINMVPSKDGFLYTYVTNRSAGKVNFDKLRVRYWKPKVRVQYDYYPYGLPWENPAVPSAGQEGLHDHLYQDKEFQFKDFGIGNEGLALYDFHARMYDPATASWSVPDPAAQFANPYLAMGNNPVISVDPDGCWINFVIGGVMGGISGYQIAQAKGATGGEMFGYILGGAAIGVASAGIGTLASTAIGTSWNAVAGAGIVASSYGGMASGVVSGVGFAALSGAQGSDILNSGIEAASYGFLGGLIGGTVPGGAGAFLSGGIPSAIQTASEGGSFGESAISFAASGSVSWSTYQVQHTYNHKRWHSNLSRKQYNFITRQAQKSLLDGRERGAWLLDDGTYDSWGKGPKRSGLMTPGHIVATDRPTNTIAEFHTHPVRQINRNQFQIGNDKHSHRDFDATDPSMVIGRNRSWLYLPNTEGGSQPIHGSYHWGVYGRNFVFPSLLLPTLFYGQ